MLGRGLVRVQQRFGRSSVGVRQRFGRGSGEVRGVQVRFRRGLVMLQGRKKDNQAKALQKKKEKTFLEFAKGFWRVKNHIKQGLFVLVTSVWFHCSMQINLISCLGSFKVLYTYYTKLTLGLLVNGAYMYSKLSIDQYNGFP